MDSRVLATISNWLDGTDEIPRHLSHVVRRPLELLTAQLVDEGEVEMVDDTSLARFMLERKYNVNLNKGGRGKKNVVHNQVLSDSRRKLGSSLRRRSFQRYQDAATEMSGKTDRHVSQNDERLKEVEELTKLYHKLDGDSEPVVEDTKSEVDKAMKMGLIIEERQKYDKSVIDAENDPSTLDNLDIVDE
jgi:hypothetical protein